MHNRYTENGNQKSEIGIQNAGLTEVGLPTILNSIGNLGISDFPFPYTGCLCNLFRTNIDLWRPGLSPASRDGLRLDLNLLCLFG